LQAGRRPKSIRQPSTFWSILQKTDLMAGIGQEDWSVAVVLYSKVALIYRSQAAVTRRLVLLEQLAELVHDEHHLFLCMDLLDAVDA
jgi:hypothetical protein